jgi:hypothetical protein
LQQRQLTILLLFKPQVQKYQLLLLCDRDEQLNDLIIFYGLLLDVHPLMTLGGAQLGGRIPRAISALVNVQKLILSDMRLGDDCAMEYLAALPRLEFLSLDGNLFTRAPAGLGQLKQVRKLSLAKLARWGAAEANGNDKNRRSAASTVRSSNGIRMSQQQQQQQQQRQQRKSSGAPPSLRTSAGAAAGAASKGDDEDAVEDNAFLLEGLAAELRGMTALEDFTFSFRRTDAVPPALVDALWRLRSFLAVDGSVVATPKKVDADAAKDAAATSMALRSPTSLARQFSAESAASAVAASECESKPPEGRALVATKFSPRALRAGGHNANALKRGGFSAVDCRGAGFSAADCRGAAFTEDECRAAGFSRAMLRAAGWSGGGGGGGGRAVAAMAPQLRAMQAAQASLSSAPQHRYEYRI